jgi:multiple sugar transport system substrate-binding protein
MRSRTVRLLIVALLAGAFAAPSSQGWLFLSPAKAAGSVTLNFLATDFPEYDAFVAAANEVGKPMGIEVKKTNVNFDDVQKKALLDFTSRVKTWDLIFVNSSWTPSFAARKLLSPIDDFLTSAQAKALVKPSDFVPATKQLTSNGKLYSMPYLSAPLMVGYRKDLFSDPSERQSFKAKYGYDLASPRTYKELLDISQFFTRKKGEMLAGKPLDEDFYGNVTAGKKPFVFSRYQDMLVAFGADLLFDPKTMRPTWNSAESAALLKYYVEFFKTMPPDVQTMTGGMSARFAAGGRSATIIHFLDLMYSSFEDPKASKVVGKFGYTLLPTQIQSRPHATVADANGIGVYALSEHKADAFKLLANTLSAQGIKTAVLKHYPEFPSMRTSVLTDPSVIQTRPGLYQAMGLMTREKVYLFALPEIKEWAQLVDVASDSILEAATNQKSVDQALNDGQERMVDIFKRAGYIK